MKKIMFSERYGLESAVLDGRKTMTRRVVVQPKHFRGHDDVALEFRRRLDSDFYFDCVVLDADDHELGQLPLPYEVGDVVAIAQRYKDAGIAPSTIVKMIDEGQNMFTPVPAFESAGWKNKMFVKADLMPQQILITDLWFERLQAISDEDCLKEGVEKWVDCYIVSGIMENQGKNNVCFDTPREAFAALIDRISGKGTWQRNPWVIAYTHLNL
jgi:hypothetical protein